VTVRSSTLERDIFLSGPMRQYRRGRNAASPSHREGEAARADRFEPVAGGHDPRRGGRSLQSPSIGNGAERET
jgi:hypothetical protein